MMLKQKWLWGLILLLLVVAAPSLVERWQAEENSNHYEIIVPYGEILTVANESELTLDEVLKTLKDAGLMNVSIEPTTLEKLQVQNVLQIYEEGELAKQLRFTPYAKDIDETELGHYISIPEEESYKTLIEEMIEPEIVTVAGELFYFLPEDNGDFTIDTPFGYSSKAIEAVQASGMNYTLRLENAENELVNQLMVEQLIELKTDQVAGLLGMGEEVIGFGQPLRDVFINELHQAGYSFYHIESSKMKGLGAIGRVTDYDVIRLHSIDINRQPTLTTDVMVDRTVRAIKERNIKSVFFHINVSDGNMEDNLDAAVSYLNGLDERMPSKYTVGAPVLFEKVTVPSWAMALVLVAGILFTFITSEILMVRALRYGATAFMILLAAAYFALDRIVFIQAFALLIAVLAPTYAVIKSAQGSGSFRGILAQYAKAVGITLVGIAIVVSLLNGNKFMTGYEVFRGVILVYLVPIACVVLYVLMKLFKIDVKNPKKSLTNTVALFNMPIRYWHVIVLVLIAAIGFFYIGRSGNGGTAPGFELAFRQWLEDLLYVRPRTKEFLIGFPFFVLAIYVMNTNKRLGQILLIPAVIGFLSIMNTFTHLHIPLEVSVLRTVYSVVLGFFIGFVFIAIYKALAKYSAKLSKRWS